MIKFNLSRVLGEKRMPQLELSKKSGIRPNTINAYYHGYIKRINVEDLNIICNILGCSVNDIVEHIPDKK